MANLSSDADSYDLAVIGCGPVGALGAILCAQAGLRVAVIEQEPNCHPLPRAVHVDHEGMRLFQSAGISRALEADVLAADGHLHIGADRGVIRYLGTANQPKPFGWANDYFLYQPELEALLRSRLQQFDSVTLQLGTRCESLQQYPEQVQLQLRSARGESALTARWVLACDGARSSVRKQLGITMHDFGFEETWLVVDAEVEGPIRFPALTALPANADLQRLSVMFCDPQRPLTVVPGRRGHRRWEFMLLPGESEAMFNQAAQIHALLAPWLEGVPHRLLRAATYRFHGLIAEQWQSGRVFLAGDAAHQTPPFFGQGMCHGLRDVANLAWKLGLVMQGVALPDLLASYQLERAAHVQAVIEATIEAGRYICVLDPEAARQRDQALRQAATQRRPDGAGALIPPLRAGAIDSSAGAGERFIQPWVQGTHGPELLDQRTGNGWRLITRDTQSLTVATQQLNASTPPLQLLAAVDLADGGALMDWLARHDALAVLVRPDFYVFGTARHVGDIASLLQALRERLSPTQPRKDADEATQH